VSILDSRASKVVSNIEAPKANTMENQKETTTYDKSEQFSAKLPSTLFLT